MLNKTRHNVYLGGAITDAPDPFTWRREIAKLIWFAGWNAVDPTAESILQPEEDPSKLVALDLLLISRCKAVIMQADVASWGSAMEMFFAYQHGIPVIVWMRPDIKRSAWLRHHSVFITDKRDEVIKHLMTIEPASSGKVFPEDPH